MSMFGEGLTGEQIDLALSFVHAGLTTLREAQKTFEQHDTVQIKDWHEQLEERMQALLASGFIQKPCKRTRLMRVYKYCLCDSCRANKATGLPAR